MKDVTVLGWYHHHNIGDEAYKLAFPRLFPSVNFTFTDKLTTPNDIIILGGGDILNNSFLKQLALQKNKRLLAMSINLLQQKDIEKTKIFDEIMIRNHLPGVSIPYCPDFAFALDPDYQNGLRLIEQLFAKAEADLYENRVVVIANSYLCRREMQLHRDVICFDRFAYEMATIADKTNASFLFLPFGNGFPVNDRIANGIVYAGCKFWKKNVLVYDQLTVQETLDICSAVDICISSRLHGCIFSCIGHTPFIDLYHHGKTEFLRKDLDLEGWGVDYWHFSSRKMQELINHFLQFKVQSSSLMAEIAQKQRKMLYEAVYQLNL